MTSLLRTSILNIPAWRPMAPGLLHWLRVRLQQREMRRRIEALRRNPYRARDLGFDPLPELPRAGSGLPGIERW